MVVGKSLETVKGVRVLVVLQVQEEERRRQKRITRMTISRVRLTAHLFIGPIA